MRLSSPRILIAGASVAVLAAAGGVAVAATGDAPAKPAAKVGATAKVDPNAQVGVTAAKYSAGVNIAAKVKTRPLPIPAISGKAAAAANAQAAALDRGETLTGDGAPPVASKPKNTVSAAAMKPVVEAKVWNNHGWAPAKMIGKLVFDTPQGKNFSCSATVVNAKNRKTILTAGHCVHGGKGSSGYWNFRFYPDVPKKWTVWKMAKVVTLSGWTKYSNPAYDVAALVAQYKIQNTTGGQGYAFGYSKRTYNMWSFGYPADRMPGNSQYPNGIPYANPNLLRYCYGTTFGIRYQGAGGTHLGMRCTMGHGASGGPWLYAPNRQGYGRIAGVNSMHSLNVAEMYSPYFGSAALDVYKRASSQA